MRLNSKVTGGLAWAGLVLVVAVPSADFLTRPAAKSVTVTSDMDAIRSAPVAPAVRPAIPATGKPVAVPAAAPEASAMQADAVEDYISSGKKLPSYISDAPEGVAQEPATTRKLVAPAIAAASPPATGADGALAGDGTAEVAAVAPKPYPASMRPKPATATAALPPPAGEAPLIIDEEDLARREAAIEPAEPFVPAGSEQIITGDELQEWDSGSLAEYLERKGLISESDLAAERLNSQFDADGFFLSDGPNNSKAKRRRVEDGDFFFF